MAGNLLGRSSLCRCHVAIGLCSAPKIFNPIADALEWCVAKAGAEVLYHYLDDFIVLGPPSSEQCAEHLLILQQVCKQLGVPLAPEKQVPA